MKIAKQIVDAGVEGMQIRSVFTCKSKTGICRKCYGRNMATGKDVEVGEAVGIFMAAQSIGEPGTQLTMRTFHLQVGLPVVETSHKVYHVLKNYLKHAVQKEWLPLHRLVEKLFHRTY